MSNKRNLKKHLEIIKKIRKLQQETNERMD